jgi:single-strand DNA-binding protein
MAYQANPQIEDRAQFVGNLGRDAEHFTTPSGSEGVRYSISVNQNYWSRQSNEVVERDAKWVKVTEWNKSAAYANTLKEGQRMLVVGRVEVSAYLREDGTAGASLELNATSAMYAGARPNGEGANEQPNNVDDIPF